MDQRSVARFTFLNEAFHGIGGFAPQVLWEYQQVTSKLQDGTPITSTRRVPKLGAPGYLVPYQRESAEKFAARAAVAVYENHLREACERFVGFLGRRAPMRSNIDAPLVQLLLQDADMRGTPLDQWLSSFALHAKARGTMLLLIDMPSEPGEDEPVSLQEQIERRRVPYLQMIGPELVTDYDLDDETGLFESVSIAVTEEVDGVRQKCTRTWTAQEWMLKVGDKTVQQGTHPFGYCPMIAFTESGDLFPHVGKYAQIADLSRAIYNARSGLDELLRSQTFSILTVQIPPEAQNQYSAMDAVATIGTSSMLTHPGITPAFVSPNSDSADTYLNVIAQLQISISRVAMDEATTEDGRTAMESGVARRLRFERLNSDLASFARRLQAMERRMWTLFHNALGTQNDIKIEWPSDFNLVDTKAELDVLLAFMATGFPPAVLTAKRRSIAGAEFDGADDEVKASIFAAIDEQDQEPAGEPNLEPTPPNS